MKSIMVMPPAEDQLLLLNKIKTHLTEAPEFHVPHIRPEIELDPYQRSGILFGNACKRFFLGDTVGLGKTVTALGIFASLFDKGEVNFGLIVCESTALHATWIKEINQMTDFQCIFPAQGQPPRSRRMMYRTQLSRRRPLIVMNWELFRKEWVELVNLGITFCIMDESSYVRNPDSQARESARAFATHCERIVMLNGTLLETNSMDAYSQVDILYPNFLGDRASFKNRYCNVDMFPIFRGGMAKYEERILPGGKNMPELRQRMDWMILSRNHLQVNIRYPTPRIMEYPVSMTPFQEQVYEDIHQNILTSVTSQKERSLKFLRKLQCCDFPSLATKQPYRHGESGKTEVLKDFIAKCHAQKDKVVVFSRYRSVCILLEQIFRQLGYTCRTITGREKDKQLRARIQQEFNRTDSGLDLLFINTAAAKSIDLDGARIIVLFDQTFNESLNRQVIGRLLRRTQVADTVHAYLFVIKDSIEEHVRKICKIRKQMADQFGQVDTAEHLSFSEMQQALMEEERIRYARRFGSSDQPPPETEPAPSPELLLPARVSAALVPGV